MRARCARDSAPRGAPDRAHVDGLRRREGGGRARRHARTDPTGTGVVDAVPRFGDHRRVGYRTAARHVAFGPGLVVAAYSRAPRRRLGRDRGDRVALTEPRVATPGSPTTHRTRLPPGISSAARGWPPARRWSRSRSAATCSSTRAWTTASPSSRWSAMSLPASRCGRRCPRDPGRRRRHAPLRPRRPLSTIVGQFAKVRLVSGSLVVAEVAAGHAPHQRWCSRRRHPGPRGALPVGLRERSQVRARRARCRDGSTAAAPTIVSGRVVGLPTAPATATGTLLAVGRGTRATGGDGRRQRRRPGGARPAGHRRRLRRHVAPPHHDRPTPGLKAREPRRDRRRRRHDDDACARRRMAGERRRARDRSRSQRRDHSPRGSTSLSLRRCRRW